MSTLAIELDATLASLAPQDAQVLERDVRDALRRARTKEAAPEKPSDEDWGEVMDLMRQHKPELVECIGALADVEFEAPPDLPPEPLKEW
jgi:hypothetical protein